MLKYPVLALMLACALAGDAAAQADARMAKQPAVVAAAHDPPDMPFRRAPMGLASRSIVVPLATNVHLAWDARLLGTHTVWEGGPLNLYGPPFNGTATRFICDISGKVLWGNPQAISLSRSLRIREVTDRTVWDVRFLGVSTSAGAVTFIYEIQSDFGKPLIILETPSLRRVEGHDVVVRKIEFGAEGSGASMLVQAERIAASPRENHTQGAYDVLGYVIKRSNDFVVVRKQQFSPARVSWHSDIRHRRATESLMTVAAAERDGRGPYSAAVTNQYTGGVESVHLEIGGSGRAGALEVFTSVCTNESQAKALDAALSIVRVEPSGARTAKGNASPPFRLPADPSLIAQPAGDDFFRVEHFPVPKDIKLMVGGMDFLPNGDLAVCTLAGEVWIVEGATNAPQRAVWRRFARGLNEPAGLKVVNGRIVVVQKCELTRLTDTDGNGEADLFECLSDDWGYNGNYHSFAFGPALDAAGNFYVMLTGHRTIYDLPRMGWALRLTPEVQGSKFKVPSSKLAAGGAVDLFAWPFERFKAEPFCSGLRCPNGFGTHQGDIFITDNQGHWVAANKLVHLQPGKFYGHPSATPAPRAQFDGDANFAPPAVWFPYAWIRSASGIASIEDARFGPFKGQLLVGEFQNASVFRVALEKVGGEWQGAVFPFTKGFASGVNRLAFGPDGRLYAGGLRMGHWTSIAPQPHSLDRVSFTGRVPFEIREVRAKADGFELAFTQPVDVASAGDVENWDAAQYTYGYEGRHNSPEKDRDEKVPGPEVRVTRATVSTDKLRVRLTIEGCKPRHVVMVRALGVKNSDGRALHNDTFHYTLNTIPR